MIDKNSVIMMPVIGGYRIAWNDTGSSRQLFYPAQDKEDAEQLYTLLCGAELVKQKKYSRIFVSVSDLLNRTDPDPKTCEYRIVSVIDQGAINKLVIMEKQIL